MVKEVRKDEKMGALWKIGKEKNVKGLTKSRNA
jgi:hypothetical protein